MCLPLTDIDIQCGAVSGELAWFGEPDDGRLTGFTYAFQAPFVWPGRNEIDHQQCWQTVRLATETREVVPRRIRFRFHPFKAFRLFAGEGTKIMPVNQERLLIGHDRQAFLHPIPDGGD